MESDDGEFEIDSVVDKVAEEIAAEKVSLSQEENELGGDDSSDEDWVDAYEEIEEHGSATDDSGLEGDDFHETFSDEEFAEMRNLREENRREGENLQKKIGWLRVKNRDVEEDNSDSESGSVYVGSEDESDEDELFAYAAPSKSNKKKRANEPFNPNTAGKDIKWRAGLVFSCKKQVKDAVREFSIATGRPLRYKVNGKKKIHVICAEGCPFRIWFSYVVEFEGWQIKTCHDEHNCIYHFSNKLVTVKYLADLYGERIRKNPNWKLSEMQDEFKKDLKVEVCFAKCCRVRRMALSGVMEEMRRHYAGLRRFGGEILRSNKDNTVKICTTRLNEGDAPHFKRFYVCYSVLKKAWKEGCRPVLGLDGCFLKTVCGGQLLSAVGRDGNNSIFPIAMAIVETESFDSWRWFLMLLVDDLQIGDGYGYTLISDQQKGLDKAVKELMPHVEHRNCTRHIYSNLRKEHGTEAVRSCFYEASMATHPEAFKTAMKKLEKVSKGAASKLNKFEPKVWSKAYFETWSKTDCTENNISECFNAWILKTRYMPIIDMLTEIHDMIMERLHQKRDAMLGVDCIVLPRVKKILDQTIRESSECRVLWDGMQNFQVKWRGIGFCVNLQQQNCSCRVWELTGIPCAHAVSAIQRMRLNPIDYVSSYFRKDTYMRAYSNCLEVLRGEPFWEETNGDIILPPPIVKQLRGRPKRQRRREGWEGRSRVVRVDKGKVSKLSRMGRVMHCSLCKKTGHNFRRCPEKSEGSVSAYKRKSKKKRVNTEEEDEIAAEILAEMERASREEQTGEAKLMDEAMMDELMRSQPPATPRRSQRLAKGTQSTIESIDASQSTLFMPTPGFNVEMGNCTGGTPLADTPRRNRLGKCPVKRKK